MINLKIIKPFKYLNKKLEIDSIISVEADKEGIPLNIFWRNRLRDSEIDNCVEIIKIKQGKK